MSTEDAAALETASTDAGLIIFDKLEGHIETMAAKFVEIGEKFGPDVIDLSLNVVRLTGAAPLFTGLVMAIATPLLIWSAFYWTKKYQKIGYPDNEMYLFAIIPSIGASVLASITSLILLLDFWNWVAVFYPVAYLAKKVMGL